MENVFELKNVYKTYKNDGREFTALKDVSLEVKEGEHEKYKSQYDG